MLSGTIIHKTCNLRLKYMHYERIRAITGKPKDGCKVILDELVNTSGECRRYSIDSSYCSPSDVAQVAGAGCCGRERASHLRRLACPARHHVACPTSAYTLRLCH